MELPQQVATYQIFVNNQDYKTLQNHVWDDIPVPAKFTVNQKSYRIGIQYRGYHIRKMRKKSFQLLFRSPSMFSGVRELHLNAEYRDPSMIRSKLSFDFFKEIGNLAPSADPVFLKLNGSNAGLYWQLESVDDLFLKKRGLADGTIFYASNDDANFSLIAPDKKAKSSLESGYTLKIGNKEDIGLIRELVYKINTLHPSDFKAEIAKWIDLPMYFLWLAGVVCTQNYDGFIQNYALYRSGQSGLFEVIPWDYDATWGRDIHGEIMEYDYVPIQGFNTLTSRLLDIPEYRLVYKSLLESILETRFTVAYLEPYIVNLQKLIRPYVLLDPYKKQDIETFDREANFILTYIRKRRSYLLDKLIQLQ
ncbi:CotH kinase family protein [Paenibacillus piri]|uniref:Spore coat protein n=1 Tax=Paenibacillus piri TaxID=2547395 RepID=A0A4V2ZTM7_9BACL|nr:CotH kinase family protein [Paenibacillus piri]TDF97674.1 spore coat protein [Paenibacillus piri]